MHNFDVVQIIVQIVVLVLSIILHEIAHGYVAYRFGDPTAKIMGRLTLNPLPHLSLWGSIIFPLLTLSMGGFFLAWANPVPINLHNIHPKKLKKAIACISLAGITTNLIISILSTILFALVVVFLSHQNEFFQPIITLLNVFISTNLVLAIFNLIPLPPLDGSRIIALLLPPTQAATYDSLQPYTFLILIMLSYAGLLRYIFIYPLYLMEYFKYFLISLLA